MSQIINVNDFCIAVFLVSVQMHTFVSLDHFFAFLAELRTVCHLVCFSVLPNAVGARNVVWLRKLYAFWASVAGLLHKFV